MALSTSQSDTIVLLGERDEEDEEEKGEGSSQWYKLDLDGSSTAELPVDLQIYGISQCDLYTGG